MAARINPCPCDELADRTAATRQNIVHPLPHPFDPCYPNYTAYLDPPTNLVYHPMPLVSPFSPHLKTVAFSQLSKSVCGPLQHSPSAHNSGFYQNYPGEGTIITNLPGYPLLYKSVRVFSGVRAGFCRGCPGGRTVFANLPGYFIYKFTWISSSIPNCSARARG